MVEKVGRLNIQEIGRRGVLFTFEKPFKTNVFIITGNNHVFLLDTFLGNEPMMEIKRYLRRKGSTHDQWSFSILTRTMTTTGEMAVSGLPSSSAMSYA